MKSVACSCLLFLTVETSGQLVGEVRTQTELAVECQNYFVGPYRNSLPANSVIVPRYELVATCLFLDVGRITIESRLPTVLTATWMAGASSQQGPRVSSSGALGWSYPGRGRGEIRSTLTMQVHNHRGSASATLTVTGNGVDQSRTETLIGGGVTSRTNIIDFTNGFLMVMSGQCQAGAGFNSSSGGASGTIEIEFTPWLFPLQQTRHGQACGAELTVSDDARVAAHALAMKVANAWPTSPVALLFGDQRASIPIQGSPCSLWLNPTIALGFIASGTGEATIPVTVPGPLQSAPFQVQAVSWNTGLQFRASDGVELQFVD
jgi:hypothetical protein